MEAYKKWVRRNKEYVHSLESLANGTTWLLPDRFSESEIGPEAVTAILGIITAINEHIIETTPNPLHAGSQEPSSFPYSLCISAVKDLETLVEVVAQHYYGEDKKWNFIAITEAVKVIVRLALLRDNGYKMLLHGGETPNVEDSSSAASMLQNNPRGQNSWNREGTAISALSRFGENVRKSSDPVWLYRPQRPLANMEAPSPMVEKMTLSGLFAKKGIYGKLFLISEVLFITRPLIYVLFIRRYGIRSWAPWFLSLAVDLTGMSILLRIKESCCSENGLKFHLSDSEKDEVRRRKLLWVLYLMRDPFFSKYTRQRLEKTEKVLEPVPIIGFLTAKIAELISGAQTRYTYMSGS